MGYQQIGGWFRGGMIATALVCPLVISPHVLAQELSAWSFDPSTQELEFSLPEGVMPEFFLLAEPARIVLDIPNIQLGDVDTEQTYDGAVERIRVSQFSDDAVRIVVDLMTGTELTPDQADIQFNDVDGRRQWRFRPLIAGFTPTVADANNADDVEPFTTLGGPGIEALALPPNLSADSLQLSQPSSASETSNLPIDPYAPAANAEVISVPSLADEPITAVSAPEINVDTDGAAATEVPPMIAPDIAENSAAVPQVTPSQAAATAISSADATEMTNDSVTEPSTTDLPALESTVLPPAPAETETAAAPPAEGDLRAVVVTPTALPEEPQADIQTEIETAETDLPGDIPEAEIREADVLPEVVEPEIDEAAAVETTPEEITGAAPTVLEEEASDTTAIAASLDPSMTPLPVTDSPAEPESAVPTISDISGSKNPAQATPVSVWPEPISFGQPLPD